MFFLAALGQSMTYTPQWLPAAAGNQTISITLTDPSPATYALLSQSKIAVRWNGQLLPTQIQPPVLGATSQIPTIEFTVPSQLRVPGITEFVLWDTTLNQPLPYRGWIAVVILTEAAVFEADTASDRVVAAVGADGTPTGTGGAVTIYQLSTGTVLQTVPVPSSARVLAFTPDTNYAWLAQNEAQGQLARLNLSTGQLAQQIQISGGTPPFTLIAQVYGDDPHILVVSAKDKTSTMYTYAYADGLQLPNGPPAGMPVPFGTDDQGRVLAPHGQACELGATAGFTNCVTITPLNQTLANDWGDKGLYGGGVFDLASGMSLFSGGQTGIYLASSNRLLFYNAIGNPGSLGPSILIADADSLDLYDDIGPELPEIREPPQRIWAPDWMMAPASVFSSAGPQHGILVGHVPELGPAPLISAAGTVNAATDLNGPIAAGEIVTLFGQNLGPAAGSGPVLNSLTQLATEVEHTQVTFDGAPGAILYTGPNQINVVVPETVEPGTSIPVQVVHYGIPSARVLMHTSSNNPGIFSYTTEGKSYAAAWNPNSALEGPNAPLKRGTYVALYATGLGLPGEVTADAVAARAEQLPVLPSVTIGGVPAVVSYAGLAPGLSAGVAQVNVLIPENAPAGAAVEVVIATVSETQGNVWVAIQ